MTTDIERIKTPPSGEGSRQERARVFLGSIGALSILKEIRGGDVKVEESLPGESDFKVRIIAQPPSGMEKQLGEMCRVLPEVKGWRRVGAVFEVIFGELGEVRGLKAGAIWWWRGDYDKFRTGWALCEGRPCTMAYHTYPPGVDNYPGPLKNTKIYWIDEGQELSMEELQKRLAYNPQYLQECFNRPPWRYSIPGTAFRYPLK